MQTIVSTPSDGRVRTSLIYLMETRAPAVVAVVVTTGPGPELEATLASLVSQDYADLSLLVLANGVAGRVYVVNINAVTSAGRRAARDVALDR